MSASARASTVYVGDRQVQTFGAGRRDDVGGIAGEKQFAELHRLDDEAAHAGDAFLQERDLRSASSRLAARRSCSSCQIFSSGHSRDIFVGLALQIEAADLRASAC